MFNSYFDKLPEGNCKSHFVLCDRFFHKFIHIPAFFDEKNMKKPYPLIETTRQRPLRSGDHHQGRHVGEQSTSLFEPLAKKWAKLVHGNLGNLGNLG